MTHNSFSDVPFARPGCRPLVLALALAWPLHGAAQWQAMGPAGGPVTAMVSVGGNWVVGSPENGLFLSTDGGATWRTANAGLPATARTGRRHVLALASDGQRTFAATEAGLYYSDSSAEPAWQPMATPQADPPVDLLAIDAPAQRLWAAARTGQAAAAAVYQADLGAGPAQATWSARPLPDGTIGLGVRSLATLPRSDGTTWLLAGTGAGLFMAEGAAGTWRSADPGGTLASGDVDAVVHSAGHGQTYACVGSAIFYASTLADGPAAWVQADTASAGGAPFACRAGLAGTLATAGTDAVFLATDIGVLASLGGTTFPAPTALPVGTGATALALSAMGMANGPQWLAGGNGGVWVLPAAGLAAASAWSPANGSQTLGTRLNNTPVADVAGLGGVVYVAVNTEPDADVQASADAGLTWAATGLLAVMGPGHRIAALQADVSAGRLYAATSAGLFMRTSAAAGWVPVSPELLGGGVRSIELTSQHLVVGTSTGLYAVPRQGSAALPAGFSGVAVTALLAHAGALYVATSDDNSTAAVWQAPAASVATATTAWAPFGATSVGRRRILAMAMAGDRLLVGTNGEGLLYATAESGWASANNHTDPAYAVTDPEGAVTGLVCDGADVFVGTRHNGVFSAPAAGIYAWARLPGSTPLPSPLVQRLRAEGTRLWAATSGGVAAHDGIQAAAPQGPAPAASQPEPAASAPASSSSGGGASSLQFLAGLVLAVAALRRRR